MELERCLAESSAQITARDQGYQKFEHPEVITHHVTVDNNERNREKLEHPFRLNRNESSSTIVGSFDLA
jgi:hypothetical protein